MLMLNIIMNMLMSMIFLFLKHPMSMGFVLLLQTILISLISGFYSYSFWFSYILFLIMIGGMLILFMYMTSLASNEKFKFSMKITSMIIISLMMFMIINFIYDKSMFYMLFKNSNLSEIMDKFLFMKNENLYSLTMMYNNPNMMITIIMINYLLLTLIAVVKITKSNSGPLRQKF
uniref:NADH-ubiquinone oxidoreductase chain 6 n=1 Tax=Porhydrus obliquesignatus TaxID=1309536 RepID=A0A894JYG8_9DYTI|nr:NADH dehydrogenase subunit 6 [Porhydrus obliquesignatus]QRV62852.1 NADH dehydrogenase subunit 6 [Porhydrus obliquesignatus]